MAKQPRRSTVTPGSGNVFADLGFDDAVERKTRVQLAHAINSAIDARRLSQTRAAAALGIDQPKVSALKHYRLVGFSVERLLAFLVALDQDVRIEISAKPRSRARARVSVRAA